MDHTPGMRPFPDRSPSTLWAPRRHQVIIWHVTPAALPSTRLLSPPERLRAASFRHPQDRDRFVAARTALRVVLGANLRTPPAEVRLTQERGGPPILEGAGPHSRRLSWSVSHAGPVVVVAVARRVVGVDVECAAAGREWTTREAFLKAGHPDTRRRLGWRCLHFEPAPGYTATVAAPGLWSVRVVRAPLGWDACLRAPASPESSVSPPST